MIERESCQMTVVVITLRRAGTIRLYIIPTLVDGDKRQVKGIRTSTI